MSSWIVGRTRSGSGSASGSRTSRRGRRGAPARSSPEPSPSRRRVRIRYTKRAPAVALSHRLLMGVWEGAWAASGLPVAGAGARRARLRISHPLAHPVGIPSLDEIIETEFTRWVTESQIRKGLAGRLPAGIEPTSMELIRPGDRGRVQRIVFEVEIPEDRRDEVAERLGRFLEASTVPVRRRGDGREVDVRAGVPEAVLDGHRLRFVIAVDPRGSVRPDEFLRALPLDPDDWLPRMLKIRTELFHGIS